MRYLNIAALLVIAVGLIGCDTLGSLDQFFNQNPGGTSDKPVIEEIYKVEGTEDYNEQITVTVVARHPSGKPLESTWGAFSYAEGSFSNLGTEGEFADSHKGSTVTWESPKKSDLDLGNNEDCCQLEVRVSSGSQIVQDSLSLDIEDN